MKQSDKDRFLWYPGDVVILPVDKPVKDSGEADTPPQPQPPIAPSENGLTP